MKFVKKGWFTVQTSECGKLFFLVPWFLAMLAAHIPETRASQPEPALPEDFPMSEDSFRESHSEWFEEMVFVGSRAQPRAVTKSVVPIHVISPRDLIGQSEPDVTDLLRNILPAYNVNPQAVGDAARIIRPANLRGLAPDHTLVLVNGKRRHRGAIITWLGTELPTEPKVPISR